MFTVRLELREDLVFETFRGFLVVYPRSAASAFCCALSLRHQSIRSYATQELVFENFARSLGLFTPCAASAFCCAPPPVHSKMKKVASTSSDWCKLIQSFESALDIRDGLTILKTSADAAVAVDGSYGHQAFLARLLGMHTVHH